jgi:hypothetical protein
MNCPFLTKQPPKTEVKGDQGEKSNTNTMPIKRNRDGKPDEEENTVERNLKMLDQLMGLPPTPEAEGKQPPKKNTTATKTKSTALPDYTCPDCGADTMEGTLSCLPCDKKKAQNQHLQSHRPILPRAERSDPAWVPRPIEELRQLVREGKLTRKGWMLFSDNCLPPE